MTYDVNLVDEQIHLMLSGFGIIDSQVDLIAIGMLYADLRGVDSHGIALLPLYYKWLQEGALNVNGCPKIVKTGVSSAVIDGGGNFGFLGASMACDEAARIAKSSGVAAITVTNSHHFGAAGFYAHKISSAGLLSFVTTSTKVVCVVPPGGVEPVLGTNPLAYGVPRIERDPIVFDIATASVAGNRIRVFKYQNKPIPEGWVVDSEGHYVTDPSVAEDIVYGRLGGGITPLGSKLSMGSHKGYGLSLMTHFFAGCLSGGSFSGRSILPSDQRRNPLGRDNIGHFILAIDPSNFGEFSNFTMSVNEVVAAMHAVESIDSSKPVMLPGEIEQRVMADRLQKGIPIANSLVQQLRDLAHTLKVPFLMSD